MSSSNDGVASGSGGRANVKVKPRKGKKEQCQHYQCQHQAYRKPVVKQPKFEGHCKDLKGFIYDCSDPSQADMYTKTTKELVEYAGRTCKHGANIYS